MISGRQNEAGGIGPIVLHRKVARFSLPLPSFILWLNVQFCAVTCTNSILSGRKVRFCPSLSVYYCIQCVKMSSMGVLPYMGYIGMCRGIGYVF